MLRQRHRPLLASDALVDFFAMNADISRCVDADAHLIALYSHDGHGHVVADHDRLIHPSRQDQHGSCLAHIGILLTQKDEASLDTKELLVSRQH